MKVEPYTSAKYKFRVRGIINEKPVKKYFRTEIEASECARRLNSAAGLKPFAPLPQCARGMNPDGPLWRVAPYFAAQTPHLKFRVFAKIEGKWRGHFFRTEREALAAANELNYQVTLQRALPAAAAPPPPAAVPPSPGAVLLPEEQIALAALDAPRKTPAEIDAARTARQSADVAALNAPESRALRLP